MADVIEYSISVDAPDWMLVGNISVDPLEVQGCGNTGSIALTLHDETAWASYAFIGTSMPLISPVSR